MTDTPQTPAEKLLADAADRAQRVVDKADVVADALLRASERNKEEIGKTVSHTVSSTLRDIFTEDSRDNPETMTIIHSKIPLLCLRVDIIDKNIDDINKKLNWFGGIIIGGVLLALLKLVLIP